jgi:hypothetical protein
MTGRGEKPSGGITIRSPLERDPFALKADLIAMLKGHWEHRVLWSFGPEERLVGRPN